MGRRDLTIRHTTLLMERMGHEPHRFIMEASEKEIFITSRFIHRTFSPTTACTSAQHSRTYINLRQPGSSLSYPDNPASMAMRIHTFRERSSYGPPGRCGQTPRRPARGSAAKRINMFTRMDGAQG